MSVPRLLLVGLCVCVALRMVACEEPGPGKEPVAEAPPDARPPVDRGPDPQKRLSYTETRSPCKEFHPYRKAYFGDLHVHGAYSFDAYAYQSKVKPADAYRFAKGGKVQLPPFDKDGKGREIQLKRPLDFAAVTEHAEFLGEIAICTLAGSAGYDSELCQKYRKGDDNSVTSLGVLLAGEPKRQIPVCGADGKSCLEMAKKRWKDIIDAAQAAYDTTEGCAFVSFIGYEYTTTPGVSNMHRNVLFRNDKVPSMPVSFYEQSTPLGLWGALKRQCIDNSSLPGCDVITIGHNSNLSNGKMFTPDYSDKDVLATQKKEAELRALLEPLLEMMQHKGSMECRNGLLNQGGADDPLCDFEKLRDAKAKGCGDATGNFGMRRAGCVSWLDFTRGILKAGLLEQKRLGLNPYRLGLIGSTDTHNGIAGYTSEKDYPGHVGTVDDTPAKRLGKGNFTHDALINNPGGLAVVWARERSRDAIFNAFRRRETYATSGPRITLRLFGGWSYPAGLCDDPQLARVGYSQGVPMGGVLSPSSDPKQAPTFVVMAQQDDGTPSEPGTPLQQLQIIKGWLDEKGKLHEKIYTVAGDPKNGASVDTKTCKRSGAGSRRLCSVWTDPDYDPKTHAFYYARAIENPSCRWSTYACNGIAPDKQPDACKKDAVPKVIQERAWSSSIWVKGSGF